MTNNFNSDNSDSYKSLKKLSSIKPLFNKLYTYQKEGVRYLYKNKGGFLLDEQGLGKTVQTIVALRLLSINATKTIKSDRQSKIDKVLIICPVCMKYTWQKELSVWWEGATVQLLESKTSINPEADVYICSYEYVARNNSTYITTSSNHLLKKLDLHGNRFAVVCDESHKIKTPKASRSRAVMYLVKAAEVKVLLTGTPITRQIDDLYNQIRVFVPDEDVGKEIGRNIWGFRTRYMKCRESAFGKEWYGVKHAEALKALLKKYALRRTKASVKLQLPSLVYNNVYVEVSKAIVKESLKYVDQILKFILDGERIASPEEADHIAKMRRTLGLAKVKPTVQYILELLEIPTKTNKTVYGLQGNKTKLVVFANHIDVIEAISASLNFKHIRTKSITGETPIKLRDEYITDFQNKDSDLQVLVLNTVVGGVGITLTAAHDEVFAELDWTPANIEQAAARCHRIGQCNDVNATFIIAKDSLDEHILRAIKTKSKNIKTVLEDTAV